ncbi:unnamed protein product, partial [Mesorhabditis spiculigera]
MPMETLLTQAFTIRSQCYYQQDGRKWTPAVMRLERTTKNDILGLDIDGFVGTWNMDAFMGFIQGGPSYKNSQAFTLVFTDRTLQLAFAKEKDLLSWVEVFRRLYKNGTGFFLDPEVLYKSTGEPPQGKKIKGTHMAFIKGTAMTAIRWKNRRFELHLNLYELRIAEFSEKCARLEFDNQCPVLLHLESTRGLRQTLLKTKKKFLPALNITKAPGAERSGASVFSAIASVCRNAKRFRKTERHARLPKHRTSTPFQSMLTENSMELKSLMGPPDFSYNDTEQYAEIPDITLIAMHN